MHGMYGTLDAELEVQRILKVRIVNFPVSLSKNDWSYHGSC